MSKIGGFQQYAGSSSTSSLLQHVSRRLSETLDGAYDADSEDGTCEPPTKRRKVIDFDGDDEEPCPICYLPFTNSGAHRFCCLACGHIFGQSCLEKWLKKGKICPLCKSKAKPKDMRVLYTKNFQAGLDKIAAKRKEVLNDLEISKNARRRAQEDLHLALHAIQEAELEIVRLRLSNHSKDKEIKELKKLAICESASTSKSSQISSTGSSSSSSVLGVGKRLFSNILHGFQ